MIYIGLLIIMICPPPPEDEQPIQFIQEQPIVQERDPNRIYRDCETCGWWSSYETESSAKMGISSHRRWCQNGHGRKPFF